MSFDFTGKRCLITSAGRGLGRALVRSMLARGATVFALCDTMEDIDTLEQMFPEVTALICDVGNWEGARLKLKTILPIHLLVNNAAVPSVESFLDITEDAMAHAFNINVFALVNISQYIAKDLIARGESGSFVNLSNIASKISVQNALSYCGTKGAVNIMSKCMARELGPHKIRVNAILPTAVSTESPTNKFWNDPLIRGSFLARHPLGSFASEHHIVDGIMFLLSELSSYITGIEMPVDGGLLAM